MLICDTDRDSGKYIARWDEVSTVTGRQLEFETVDLEAIREAFRDHMDKEQAKEEKVPEDREPSAPEAEKAPEDRGTSVPKAEKVPEDLGTSVPKEEKAPEDRDTSASEEEKIPEDLGTSVSEEENAAEDLGMSVSEPAEYIGFPADVQEPAGQEDPDSMYFDMVIGQLSKRYEDKHRMSVELSSDVFTAIGRAKARARQDHEEAEQRVSEATAVVDDATRKLRIIEKRYEKARGAELHVKRELQSLPYVAEAAITETRKEIEREKDELAGFKRDLPLAEQFEVTARMEALTALKATLGPESYAAEKKKVLDAAEKLRNLTDYLLTVAKKSQGKERLEAEYAAARREASIRNAAYTEAYREYSKAESLLKDARVFAREKRNLYDTAHKDTMRIRRKIDVFTDLIDADESKLSQMMKASAKYDKVFAEYQGRKKIRLAGGRQLDAAREEYARLLNALAEAKSRAEDAADRMYRAEKISVRDVIETDVKDPDFLYLNRYGALLAKAQADEQAALGELRRAQKKSDTV